MKIVFANKTEKTYIGAMELPIILDGVRRDGVEVYFDAGENLNELKKLYENPKATSKISIVNDDGEVLSVYEGYTVPRGMGIAEKSHVDFAGDGFVTEMVSYITLSKSSEIDAIVEDIRREKDAEIARLNARVFDLENMVAAH